jgi:YspA, cpYpsA-related SLOG family
MNGYLAPILVTGSRTWDDVQAIRTALADAWHAAREDGWPGIEVIEGQASGADSIAAAWAREHHHDGVGHHPMPAAWERCAPNCPAGHRRTAHDRTYCPTAGHRRNAAMIAAGPLLALAFLMPCTSARCTRPRPHDSHGATHCTDLARAAGIPVTEVRP